MSLPMDAENSIADAPEAALRLHHSPASIPPLTIQPQSRPRSIEMVNSHGVADVLYDSRLQTEALPTEGKAMNSVPSHQLSHGRMPGPASQPYDRKESPGGANDMKTPLPNYRERLAEGMSRLPKPPAQSVSSPGSTIEDTEEDHEAAIELCLGPYHSSSAKGRGDVLAQYQNTSERALSGNSHMEASDTGFESHGEPISVPEADALSTRPASGVSATDCSLTCTSSGATVENAAVSVARSSQLPSDRFEPTARLSSGRSTDRSHTRDQTSKRKTRQQNDNSAATSSQEKTIATTPPSDTVSFAPTASSKCSLSAEQAVQPLITRTDRTPLNSRKRLRSDAFEQRADKSSKYIRTASTSLETKHMTGPQATVDGYITCLQRYIENRSSYESPYPVISPADIAHDSGSSTATANPSVNAESASTRNGPASRWWNDVMRKTRD